MSGEISIWPAKLLPLTEADWKRIADAIGPGANRITLSDGKSLREGFQMAISLAVEEAAEPTVGQRAAESRHFVEVVVKAFKRMSPKTREEWADEYGADFARSFKHCWDLVHDAHKSDKEDTRNHIILLPDIVWLLVKQCGVANTLPGNAYLHRAKDYALVRSTRIAVKVAVAVAERHQPAAAPVLRRLNRSNDALVSRLRRALRMGGRLQLEHSLRHSLES
jgi:hypothetical protein